MDRPAIKNRIIIIIIILNWVSPSSELLTLCASLMILIIIIIITILIVWIVHLLLTSSFSLHLATPFLSPSFTFPFPGLLCTTSLALGGNITFILIPFVAISLACGRSKDPKLRDRCRHLFYYKSGSRVRPCCNLRGPPFLETGQYSQPRIDSFLLRENCVDRVRSVNPPCRLRLSMFRTLLRRTCVTVYSL